MRGRILAVLVLALGLMAAPAPAPAAAACEGATCVEPTCGDAVVHARPGLTRRARLHCSYT